MTNHEQLQPEENQSQPDLGEQAFYEFRQLLSKEEETSLHQSIDSNIAGENLVDLMPRMKKKLTNEYKRQGMKVQEARSKARETAQVVADYLRRAIDADTNYDMITGKPKEVQSKTEEVVSPQNNINESTKMDSEKLGGQEGKPETPLTLETVQQMIEERVAASESRIRAEFEARETALRNKYESEISQLKSELATKGAPRTESRPTNSASKLDEGFKRTDAKLAAARERIQARSSEPREEPRTQRGPSLSEIRRSRQDLDFAPSGYQFERPEPLNQPLREEPRATSQTPPKKAANNPQPTPGQSQETVKPQEEPVVIEESTKKETRLAVAWGNAKTRWARMGRVSRTFLVGATLVGIGFLTYPMWGEGVKDLIEKGKNSAKRVVDTKDLEYLMRTSVDRLWSYPNYDPQVSSVQKSVEKPVIEDFMVDHESDHERRLKAYPNYEGDTHAEKVDNRHERWEEGGEDGAEAFRHSVENKLAADKERGRPTPLLRQTGPKYKGKFGIGREPGQMEGVNGPLKADALYDHEYGTKPVINKRKPTLEEIKAYQEATQPGHPDKTYTGFLQRTGPRITQDEMVNQIGEAQTVELLTENNQFDTETVNTITKNLNKGEEGRLPRIEVTEETSIRTARELLDNLLSIEAKRKALDVNDPQYLQKDKELLHNAKSTLDKLKLPSISSDEAKAGIHDVFSDLEETSQRMLNEEYASRFGWNGEDLWLNLDSKLRADLKTQEILHDNIIE